MIIRAYFIFITITLLGVSASAQRISLSVKKAPLKKVFRELQAQSGYVFVYSENDLKNAKPVTLNIAAAHVISVLDLLFADQDLTYTISRKTVVIKLKKNGIIEKLKDIIESLKQPDN